MNPETDLLSVLTREGVLVHASVRYPRFHKKLTAPDLGLDPERVSERLVHLGHKRLLPRDSLAEFSLVESRTHALVEKSTFPFLGGLGRFLPNGKLADLRERLNAQELRFRQARDRFLADYDRLRGEALGEWREATRRIAKTDEEGKRLFSQIESSFPPREELEPRFSFRVHLFQIAVPEDLGVELVTFGAQNEVRRARREAAENATRQIRAGVEDFVGECVSEMRRQTAQLCGEMLESMRSGKTGGVHQRTLNRLVSFIDEFKRLNFADDAEMERELERVRTELLGRSAEDYRGSPAATRSLEAGLAELRDRARELAESDAGELVERFGQLGRRRLQRAA